MNTVEEIMAFKQFAEPDNPTTARILKIAREMAAKADQPPPPPKPIELGPNAVNIEQINADLQAAHDKLVMTQHEKNTRKQKV
jgi:hypothetical protein